MKDRRKLVLRIEATPQRAFCLLRLQPSSPPPPLSSRVCFLELTAVFLLQGAGRSGFASSGGVEERKEREGRGKERVVSSAVGQEASVCVKGQEL